MSALNTPFWKRGDKRRAEATAGNRGAIEQLRAQLRGNLDLGLELAEQAENELLDQIEENSAFLVGLGRKDPAELQAWGAEAWRHWSPDPSECCTELRVGSVVDEELGHELGLPVVVPVHEGATAPVVVVSHTPGEHLTAASVLGSLAARAALCFPKQAHFALLDPLRRGATFPFSKWLDRVALGFEDVDYVLEELLEDIARIERTYLDRGHPTFAELPPELTLGEHVQFLVVPSFPSAYTEAQQAAIRTVCERGGASGVQVLLHLEGSDDRSGTELLGDEPALADATVLDLAGTAVEVPGLAASVRFDELPATAVLQAVFQRLATTARRDTTESWALARTESADWWTELAEHAIAAPIGVVTGDGVRELWFGTDEELGRSCLHGLAVGNHVARSQLFDLVLAGVASAHAPSSVHVRLVDSDTDSLLSAWAQLPHTELSALRPSPAQARAALADLVELAEQRAAAGAGPLPRVLAVVADLSRLAADALAEDSVAGLVTRLAACGDVGVHLLAGAPSGAAAAAALGPDAVTQIDLRIAVGEQPAGDGLAELFLDAGAGLARRICDRPGRALVNSLRGAVSANQAMRLMLLEAPEREQLIADAKEEARQTGERLPRRLVVNGADHPDLLDDPMLNALVANRHDPAALHEVLRDGWNDGQQTVEPWSADDVPRFAPLGRSRSTARGVASSSGLVLRRGATENVLVVMAERELRSGVTTSVMLGVGLSTTQADTEIWIADRAAPGTPAGDAVRAALETLEPAGVAIELATSAEQAAQMIARLATEMERRLALGDAAQAAQATILFVLSEPDRVSLLHRVPTSTGAMGDSPLGATLKAVLATGPLVGIHTLVAVPSVAAGRSVLDDTTLHHSFRHRVVTRIGDEDSFAVVRSARAASLEHHPDRPAPALLFDSVDHSTTEFTPYSTTGESSGRPNFSTQVAELTGAAREQAAP